jgi:Na+/H+-translocating membrane pyrophosphatase
MNTPDVMRQVHVPPAKPQTQISSILDDRYAIEIRRQECQAELESRLRIQEANAQHERRKDAILFGVMLTVALLIIIVCIAIILSPTSSLASINWATGAITSLAAGVSGYLFGRVSNKSRDT